MMRICSRCRAIMGFIGEDTGEETHGTCPPCLEIEKEEIRKYWRDRGVEIEDDHSHSQHSI